MICTWQKLCKGLQKRLKIDRRKEGKKQNESKETDRTKLKKKNCPPITHAEGEGFTLNCKACITFHRRIWNGGSMALADVLLPLVSDMQAGGEGGKATHANCTD